MKRNPFIIATPKQRGKPHDHSSRLRPGRDRHARSRCSPLLPDVSTLAEQGMPELTVWEWFGFYAPACTQAPVVAAANAAMDQTLKDAALVDGLGIANPMAQGCTAQEMA